MGNLTGVALPEESDIVEPRKLMRTFADIAFVRTLGLLLRTAPVSRSSISSGCTVAGMFCA